MSDKGSQAGHSQHCNFTQEPKDQAAMFLRKAAELVITGWQERQSVHTQQNKDAPDLIPAEHHLAQASEQQVLTSGVSYVCQSSLSLHHLVMRPLSGNAKPSSKANEIYEALRSEAAGIMWAGCSESQCKEYLLCPQMRDSIAEQHRVVRLSSGGLPALKQLKDRHFLCLHFHLDGEGTLTPCSSSTNAPQSERGGTDGLHSQGTGTPCASSDSNRRRSVLDSNVQLVASVRKSCGGTSAAKKAAKELSRHGTLEHLMQWPVCHGKEGLSSAETSLNAGEGEGADNAEEAEEPAEEWLEAEPSTPTLYASVIADAVLTRHETAHEGKASSGEDAQHANASQSAAVQLKLYSRSVRLELFCSQSLWHTLTIETQGALLGAMHSLEQEVAELFKKWNWEALVHHAQELVQALSADMPSQGRASSTICCAQVEQQGIPEDRPETVDDLSTASTKPLVASEGCTAAVQEPSSSATEGSCQHAETTAGSSATQLSSSLQPASEPSCSALLSEILACIANGTTPYGTPTGADPFRGGDRIALHSSEPPGSPTGQHMSENAEGPCNAKVFLERLHAALEAPLSPATALAVLAAVHVGAASLGRAAAVARMPWPLYLIGTRDSFAHHLHVERSQVQLGGRRCIKTDFFFKAPSVPANYFEVVGPIAATAEQSGTKTSQRTPVGKAAQQGTADPVGAAQAAPTEEMGTTALPQEGGILIGNDLLPVGITTYTEFFSEAEMQRLEAEADGMHAKADARLPPTAFHKTHALGGALRRTKMFFGARYLWTREQKADKEAARASGVRVDVPHPPTWMREDVERPLVEAGLAPAGFADSWALNMYHDGSQGIQPHFDDAARFERPVYSLRLFSDSRLSFGTQLYGYTNGAFCVDMPRGAITIMHKSGYAVTGAKHCVRPVDLSGKSAALIMRRMSAQSMQEARQLEQEQLVQQLSNWSMKDGPAPISEDSAQPLPSSPGMANEEELQRDCMRVLNRCIQQLEADAERSRIVGAAVQSVMDTLLNKVEAQAKKEMKGKTAVEGQLSPREGALRHDPFAPPTPCQASQERHVFEIEWTSQLRRADSHGSSVYRADRSAAADAASALEAHACSVLSACASSAKQQQPRVQRLQADRASTPVPKQSPLLQQPSAACGPMNGTAGQLKNHKAWHSQAEGQQDSAAAKQTVKRLGPMQAAKLALAKAFAEPAAIQAVPRKRSFAGSRPPRAGSPDAKRTKYAGQEQPSSGPASKSSMKSQQGQPYVESRAHLQSATAPQVTCSSGPGLAPHPHTHSKIPTGAICAKCERSVAAGNVSCTLAWACKGPCCQSFHSACAPPVASLQCFECSGDMRVCFFCKQLTKAAQLVKCATVNCGRFYHPHCAARCPLTSWRGNQAFLCALHCCAYCGLPGQQSGGAAAVLQCLRCPIAYHVHCKPANITALSRRFIICPRH